NRAVETKFLNYVALTHSGMTESGLLAAETGNSITLRGPEGKEQTILRADLEELAGTSKSMMPEGLEKDLAHQDLADIIAHVRSNVPLQNRKELVGNDPRLVRAAADGTLVLPANACEVYGSTLLFETHWGNLGYWASADDYAVWTVEARQAGRYVVEFDWACEMATDDRWELETGSGKLTGVVESDR